MPGLSPITPADGTIFFGSQDDDRDAWRLYGLSGEGNVRWQFEGDAFAGNTPVLDDKGNVYVVGSKYAYCIDSAGQQVWKVCHRVEDVSECVLLDGMLCFASEKSLILISGAGQLVRRA